MTIMARPHLLVIAYPTQGHVMPLMELSHNLVDRGFKITFVNTEFNHKRVVAALSNNNADYEEFIHLASIPDGMEPEEDRNQLGKLSDLMENVMPEHLEELIKNINESDNGDSKITCVLADANMGWALEVADKLSIRRAAFWPASGVLLAVLLHIPKMIEDGIIDTDGSLKKTEMIQLSPEMPAMNPAHFVWLLMGDLDTQKSIFNLIVSNNRAVKLADYFVCNSFPELEPSVFTLVPNLQPIGPLCASSRLAQFWPEDSTCLNWLDQQPAHSVIYVAFGSLTILDKRQFDELALGLELSGQRFLWVVRPDLTEGTDTYPDGFEERVGSRGQMVGWAPQREVLAHPSVACFLTHCGWNSTIEGLSHGVPFLCWPYFADQIVNKSYICDLWKIGLGFNPDENGLISKEEIKTKVISLLGDEEIKERSLNMKEIAKKNVSNGGASFKNFEDFVQGIK
ncbi:hypothetical protein AQUCO_00200811v1 [Aquilegia coerulea]|uniref:Uncharacterized protein n=1 Tax=Aquilegia coerulea TaxID=218851 RepID=A0A2G5F4U9_AQUCA|nr:hypothetical protein AQUCO_00200811v1 [Aquilegia coerulea]